MKNLLTVVVLLLTPFVADVFAADLQTDLLDVLENSCVHCHNSNDRNGEVSFEDLDEAALAEEKGVLDQLFDVLSHEAMPPEDEPELESEVRQAAIAAIKELIADSAKNDPPPTVPLQRLNRFQYNNTVRDLFQLDRDVFALPEKLMTRHSDYLQHARRTGVLPEVLQVASHALKPVSGLADVKPFPKDLRAEHGYDNQADQLTLSPLLLDAFLRLSVSIVESSDFNEQTVGVWQELFAGPEQASDYPDEIRRRLAAFLPLVFRGPVDQAAVDRYTAYTLAKMQPGASFTEGMKKVSAAALSSPLFLFRNASTEPSDQPYILATQLSYYLWGSCPDAELLDLARQNQLVVPEVLASTVTRMLSDPKIERFLDAFPVQWMQLENLMASTPDRGLHKYFYVDAKSPASVQMVLEPLLLFDAVFAENRPLIELVQPTSIYQSDFLTAWYQSDLKPPAIDKQALLNTNQERDQQRQTLQAKIADLNAQASDLADPIRKQLLQQRFVAENQPVQDLKPYAAWEFNGDLTEQLRGLDLTANGDVTFQDGKVNLSKSYLISEKLPIELKAKSLEVRFVLQNLDQRGGGLMGVLKGGGFFDTIVIGERKNRHWISGSNGFSRTKDFPNSFEETVVGESIHLLMVYQEDGTTKLYRNGAPYGEPYRKGKSVFTKDQSTVVFGLRHLPPGGNRFLSVSIDNAKLYDRALTAEEAAAAASGSGFVSHAELLAAMSADEQQQWKRLNDTIAQLQKRLSDIPANIDLKQVANQNRQRFEGQLRQQLNARDFKRVAVDDPRYGGIVTNSAVLSMTSGPKRTHPVARGVWMTEVLFNDPPSPPPNDVPTLDEDPADKNLTIRERFEAHRSNSACAGCHAKLDPLGFALENFDITGRWRDKYRNGRVVDSAGVLHRKHAFTTVTEFKSSLVKQQQRFQRAFVEHLLRYALGRELEAADILTVDRILHRCQADGFTIAEIVKKVAIVGLARSTSAMD
ncbi:MAG: DUF1588 domain-containing protein [Planctomycetota bacterium]|nr:DUF1588 domain-containing protein [Planctomycetota bacterium]